MIEENLNTRISIVIPTYTNVSGVRACLESIVKYTDLSQTEIIVVANGAAEDTKELYREFPAQLIWLPEACGYTTATNIGIKAASGDFLVLLNDDCVLLEQVRNEWINVLLQPFLDDPKMGITGPVMNWCPAAERHFLIFFCVMIRKTMLDEIGTLDEIFSPGSGEDTDLCCRAVDSGWAIRQVPSEEPTTLVDKGCEDLPEWKRQKMHTANFRLYHDGNATFSLIPEIYESAMRKNHAILQERYRKPVINIERARVIDGWFAESELTYVAQQAQHCKVVIEIGSWHGRSSRGIADNLPEDGKLVCCDSWNGSSGEPEMHGSAKLREGDHAHSWWWCNLHDLIVAGKVIPIRMQSVNAAITLKTMNLSADMVFIDASHDYENVKADILAWRHVIKDGGLWCGHDYYLEGQEPFAWMGVRQAVNELFPDVQQVPGTSIWWSRSKPLIKPVAIDCIIADDLNTVEQRFRDMDSQVDRWIVIEGKQTRDGQWKPLYFAENMGRFEPWLHKVTHISGFEFKGDPNDLQGAEDRLWDATTIGMTDCKDEDIIIFGDVRVPYKTVKELTPSGARARQLAIAYQIESQCDDPEYAKQVEQSQRKILGEWFRDIPRDAAILDVGCGKLRILSETFANVTGIDLIDAPDVIKTDMHAIPYDDNSFDVVYSSHSLEHAYDPIRVLSEFKRILKPEGQLFVVLPYPDYIDSEHRAKAHCGSIPLDLTVADEGKSLIRVIESAGFKNTYCEQGSLRGEPEIYLEFSQHGRVFDTFIFHNELDLLEMRLETLWDTVDRFVIVEGALTHSGQPKPLYFEESLNRFERFLPKITHIIVDDYPEANGSIYDNAWMRERWQRDAIMRGLTECNDDDIIILGDADEIANPEAIKNYRVEQGLCRLKQRLFYYYLNNENREGWDWLKIAPYKIVKELSPCGVRYPPAGDTPLIENGGWHFSFIAPPEGIAAKIRAFAHVEYDKPEFTDVEKIAECVANGDDVFNRGTKYEVVPIDETFPEYVREHEVKLRIAGLIKPYYPLAELMLPPNMFKRSPIMQGEPQPQNQKKIAHCEHCGRTDGQWVGRFCLKCLETCGPKALTQMHQMHPGDLAEIEREFNEPNEPKAEPSLSKKHWTVTACVSTKDRYSTTLPLCISAIATQTRKVDKLVIYDDGEQVDLHTISPFEGLLKMLGELKIPYEIFRTPRKGQVVNHQHCLDSATTDFIFRVDDDEIPMPDCLEKLLNTVRDHGLGGEAETIGAVAGLVLHPGAVNAAPDFLDGSLKDVERGMNLQWFDLNGSGVKEVQHLYSSFLYSVSAARKAGGYPKELSAVGHREETILSHQLYRAGYKLLIQPHALTWHLRESTGGIRSFNDQSLWEHDEQIFQSYLKEWGAGNDKPTKILNCDFGLGDHWCLKTVLPQIRERHQDKELILATCYPSVFEDCNIKQISIADHKNITGDRYEDSLLYKWMIVTGNNKPLREAMLEFWL